MISDAEIEWLDSEMKYKLGFRDTVKIAEACLALIARLRAAEKERDIYRANMPKSIIKRLDVQMNKATP